MSYGIGRVPADVDPTEEAWAVLEAERIMADLVPPPRRRRESVAWQDSTLYHVPFLACREPDRKCAECGKTIPALAPQGERIPENACFAAASGVALCVPCGRRLIQARDAAALAYLLTHREEFRAEAIASHLRGNDWQGGAHHARWLLGHAILTACCQAKIEPPSWWGDWDDADGPLQRLMEHLPGGALPVGGARAREALSCRKCGQSGLAGAYPFSTLPGSGRCDDCV